MSRRMRRYMKYISMTDNIVTSLRGSIHEYKREKVKYQNSKAIDYSHSFIVSKHLVGNECLPGRIACQRR